MAHVASPVHATLPNIKDPMLPDKIVSGGQTGADRAALDWAIRAGIEHGGWCPKGRLAADGPIAARYRLVETDSTDYAVRTRLNVRDSDATLILNLGALDGGTALTAEHAHALDRPCLTLQLDAAPTATPAQAAAAIDDWMTKGGWATLNIAGPREQGRPGIYAATTAALDAWLARQRKGA
jgi:hypothetical protein